MSDQVARTGGGGQPGYYVCSHSGCAKKARNVDPWHRSAQLLSGDHLCCQTTRHTAQHAYRERERQEAAEAAARQDVPLGPVALLIRSVVRAVLGSRRQ